MSLDLPPLELGCHRTGFEKKCRDLVSCGLCNRWIGMTGMDANTGQSVKPFDCVDNWHIALLLENSKLQRETGAAVESFRNEMVKANQISLAATLGEDAVKLLLPDRKNGG